MLNVGLFFFSKNVEDVPTKNIFNRIKFKITAFINYIFCFARFKKASVNKVDILENSSIYFIEIPLNVRDALKPHTKKKVEKYIRKYSMELNLKECYYPSNLAPLDIRGIMRNPYDGEIIYISLLKFIIEKLLKKQQKSIKEQEITIIQENNSEILYYFLEELAPVVKFLNVVTYEREKVEKFLESICEETGLSVRVTNDFSSDVRSVDILINIGDLAKIRNGNNIPASTIIVNYGKLEEKFLRNNFVINDLKIRMDEDIDKAVKIAEEKFRDIEIADLVINRLLVSQSKDLSFRHKMELTSKKFVEKGWSISKLNSHHINVKNSE